MDNVVDNQGTSPAPGGPTDPQRSEGASSRYDERISQLTRQREEAQRGFQQAREDLGSVRSELSDLRSLVERIVPQQHTEDASESPRSWADIPAKQLKEALNPETFQSNPDTFQAALDELIRRRVDAGTSRALKEFGGHLESRESAREVETRIMGQIVQDFGRDAQDRGSELFKMADQIYGEKMVRLEQMYPGEGRNRVRSDPWSQYEAFREAKLRLSTVPKQDYESIRTQLDRQNRFRSMESGISGALSSNNERSDLLRKGDVRGAIRRTGIVRSFEEG